MDPLLALVLMVTALVGVVVWGAWSLKRPERDLDLYGAGASGGEGTCVACGSDDVVEPAERVYVCSSCGYEGGEGLPAFQWQQKVKRLAALSPEKRAARAAKLRENARLILVSAREEIKGARDAALSRGPYTPIDPNNHSSGPNELAASHRINACVGLLMETIRTAEEVGHLTHGRGRRPELFDSLTMSGDWQADTARCERVLAELERALA